MGWGQDANAEWVDAALAPWMLRSVLEPTGRGHRITAQGRVDGVDWQLLAEWAPDGDSDAASGSVLLTAPALACPPLDLARVQAGEPPRGLRLSGWQTGADLGLLGRWVGQLAGRLRGRSREPEDPLAGLKLHATPEGALDPALLRRLAQWPERPDFHLSVSPMQALCLRAELWDDTPQLGFMLAWWHDLIPSLQRQGLVLLRDPDSIVPPTKEQAEQLMAMARQQLGRRPR